MSTTSDDRPNILVLMTDQHNPVLMGPNQAWGVRTPHIDSIAAEGMRFDNAYAASPVCVPSRCSFMSGLYPHKHEALDNGASMPTHVPTFAHALTVAGYETVLCARMHFNGQEIYHGFEHRLATDLCNPVEYPAPPATPSKLVDPVYAGRRAADCDDGSYAADPSPVLTYDDHVCAQACDWLRARGKRKHERPFLLVTSFYGPHPMLSGREEYRELFDEYFARDLGAEEISEEQFNRLPAYVRRAISGGKENGQTIRKSSIHRFRAGYFSRVTYTDGLIGKVLEALSASQLKEDTIIIYLSDHGEQMGDHGTIGKSQFYDYSSRVPLIVSMPDRRAGVIRQNVSLTDIFPTLCDLAGGVELEHELDGRSLLPLMDGGAEDEEAVVYAECFDWMAQRPVFMVKRGPWKYCCFDGEPEFLFHLGEDPHEWRNCAAERDYADVLTGMRAALRRIVDPDAVRHQVEQNRARRRLIHRATESSPATRARLRQRIRAYREAWDEPYWDDNERQSEHEPFLHWDEEAPATRLPDVPVSP